MLLQNSKQKWKRMKKEKRLQKKYIPMIKNYRTRKWLEKMSDASRVIYLTNIDRVEWQYCIEVLWNMNRISLYERSEERKKPGQMYQTVMDRLVLPFTVNFCTNPLVLCKKYCQLNHLSTSFDRREWGWVCCFQITRNCTILFTFIVNVVSFEAG